GAAATRRAPRYVRGGQQTSACDAHLYLVCADANQLRDGGFGHVISYLIIQRTDGKDATYLASCQASISLSALCAVRRRPTKVPAGRANDAVADVRIGRVG